MAADDACDLYGLPLDRFVPDRSALAKELRSQGQREEAKRVAALRKPSVAAWAVNQLVRSQPKVVAELYAAGDALQRAQAELLGGRGDRDELRAATDRERELVEQLRATASGLLSSDGAAPSATTLDRVSETLHAAALEAQAREAVRSGCLERELRHVGLGSEAAASTATPTARVARDQPAGERAERDRIEREQRERLASAREAETQARRDADRAARAVEAAGRRRDRAAEALREAEALLDSARKQADAARTGHRSAQQALQRAGRSARSPGRSE